MVGGEDDGIEIGRLKLNAKYDREFQIGLVSNDKGEHFWQGCTGDARGIFGRSRIIIYLSPFADIIVLFFFFNLFLFFTLLYSLYSGYSLGVRLRNVEKLLENQSKEFETLYIPSKRVRGNVSLKSDLPQQDSDYKSPWRIPF